MGVTQRRRRRARALSRHCITSRGVRRAAGAACRPGRQHLCRDVRREVGKGREAIGAIQDGTSRAVGAGAQRQARRPPAKHFTACTGPCCGCVCMAGDRPWGMRPHAPVCCAMWRCDQHTAAPCGRRHAGRDLLGNKVMKATSLEEQLMTTGDRGVFGCKPLYQRNEESLSQLRQTPATQL